MNKHRLPRSVEIDDIECPINSDYRDILDIFEIFNDKNLLQQEKTVLALETFYKTSDYLVNIEKAAEEMLLFIDGGEHSTSSKQNNKPVYSWDQDFNIIVAPINKVIGQDVRGLEYLHWWTFLSAFMEIGECTFSTYVSIREKLNNGKKLEKYEEKILRENRDSIILKKKYDSTTQGLLDEIMGR